MKLEGRLQQNNVKYMEKIKNREKGLNIELEKNYKISNDSSPSKSKYKFVTVHSLIEYLLQKRVLRSR